MAKRKIKLKEERFYIMYGGNTHPAFIYKKTNHGTFLAIKIGTTFRKGMIAIHPVQKEYSINYVHYRPFEGTRKDFGNKELLGMCFDLRDQNILQEIKKRKSKLTRSAKKSYRDKKMPSSD